LVRIVTFVLYLAHVYRGINPDVGGSTILRIYATRLPDCVALYPRRLDLHLQFNVTLA